MYDIFFGPDPLDPRNNNLDKKWIFDESFIKSAMQKHNFCIESDIIQHRFYNLDECFYVSMYPNGKEDDQKGQFWIYVHFLVPEENCCPFHLKVSTPSGFSKALKAGFYQTETKGFLFATHAEMLDPKLGFFNNDKFCLYFQLVVRNIKWSECFTQEIAECGKGKKLRQKLFNSVDTKDLKIFVENREISVHKCVLAVFSPIFKAMIAAASAEEKAIEVTGFDYEIVKLAVEFSYGEICLGDLKEIDELLSLLKFSDTFQMEELKESIEVELDPKINSINICKIANCALESNAKWTNKRCMEKLIKLMKSQEVIPDFTTLNPIFMTQIRDAMILPEFQTFYPLMSPIFISSAIMIVVMLAGTILFFVIFFPFP